MLPRNTFWGDNIIKKTVGIFVDFENIRKCVFESANKKLNHKINYNQPRYFFKFIESFVNEDEDVFRIFLYLSRPMSEVTFQGKKHDFTAHPAYKAHVRFIETMETKDLIAVRKGKLKFRGFKDKQKTVPDIVQKQVDMLLGLDIAHLAYNNLVDRIMIFSEDTDIVPALKVARINGLQVVVPFCSDLQNLNNGLLAHADFVRPNRFMNIFPKK